MAGPTAFISSPCLNLVSLWPPSHSYFAAYCFWKKIPSAASQPRSNTVSIYTKGNPEADFGPFRYHDLVDHPTADREQQLLELLWRQAPQSLSSSPWSFQASSELIAAQTILHATRNNLRHQNNANRPTNYASKRVTVLLEDLLVLVTVAALDTEWFERRWGIEVVDSTRVNGIGTATQVYSSIVEV